MHTSKKFKGSFGYFLFALIPFLGQAVFLFNAAAAVIDFLLNKKFAKAAATLLMTLGLYVLFIACMSFFKSWVVPLLICVPAYWFVIKTIDDWSSEEAKNHFKKIDAMVKDGTIDFYFTDGFEHSFDRHPVLGVSKKNRCLFFIYSDKAIQYDFEDVKSIDHEFDEKAVKRTLIATNYLTTIPVNHRLVFAMKDIERPIIVFPVNGAEDANLTSQRLSLLIWGQEDTETVKGKEIKF